MIITDAHIEQTAGGAVLHFMADGQPASFDGECRLLNHGIPAVCLGPGWADRLPPFHADIPQGDGTLRAMTFHGFSDDGRIVALARWFCAQCDAGRVEPGPVKIPQPASAND